MLPAPRDHYKRVRHHLAHPQSLTSSTFRSPTPRLTRRATSRRAGSRRRRPRFTAPSVLSEPPTPRRPSPRPSPTSRGPVGQDRVAVPLLHRRNRASLAAPVHPAFLTVAGPPPSFSVAPGTGVRFPIPSSLSLTRRRREPQGPARPGRTAPPPVSSLSVERLKEREEEDTPFCDLALPLSCI